MARSALDIPTAPRTAVFRALDQIVRADPTINGVFGNRIRSWTGDELRDAKPFTTTEAPALRLTPVGMGQDEWYSPDEQFGELGIEVEIFLRGTLIDDLMNVWWAVQRAIYPVTGAQPNANLLNAAGATTGMVTFADPAFDRQMAEQSGYMRGIGSMKVEIREILNP